MCSINAHAVSVLDVGNDLFHNSILNVCVCSLGLDTYIAQFGSQLRSPQATLNGEFPKFKPLLCNLSALLSSLPAESQGFIDTTLQGNFQDHAVSGPPKEGQREMKVMGICPTLFES